MRDRMVVLMPFYAPHIYPDVQMCQTMVVFLFSPLNNMKYLTYMEQNNYSFGIKEGLTKWETMTFECEEMDGFRLVLNWVSQRL